MSQHVYRYVVLADDLWETFEFSGPILHVATRHELSVELWVLDDPEQPLTTHSFRVFGTGQPLTDDVSQHIGTAITPSGRFVWHLFERRPA